MTSIASAETGEFFFQCARIVSNKSSNRLMTALCAGPSMALPLASTPTNVLHFLASQTDLHASSGSPDRN